MGRKDKEHMGRKEGERTEGTKNLKGKQEGKYVGCRGRTARSEIEKEQRRRGNRRRTEGERRYRRNRGELKGERIR